MKRNIVLKGLFSIVLVTALCLNANAQKRFGVKFGYSMSHASMAIANPVSGQYTKIDDTKPNHGFHVGIITQMDMSDYFAIQPGIMLATKGYSATGKVLNTKINSMNYYLEVPIQLMGKYPFNDFNVFGLFGPVFSVGLFGKTKISSKLGSESYGNFVNNSESGSTLGQGKLKRFDLGLDMGAGVEVMDMLQFSLHYVVGLLNQYNPSIQTDYPPKYKNGSFMVSIAFLF